MDKNVVRNFWRRRAEAGSTRWTGETMLEFDRTLLAPFVLEDSRILDLGSGFGELSRSLGGGSLVAVDQEPEMATDFRDDPRYDFILSSVVDFSPPGKFDLILLFGVVTHLTEEEEEATYSVIADALAVHGTAVIKNQCSDGESFEVDTFSADLGIAYVGRYPSVEHQRALLAERFTHVEVVHYPEELRMHTNSSHVAFVCSQEDQSRS